jgi:distribution and morphology protein 31
MQQRMRVARESGLQLDPADVEVNFTYWDLDVESIDITLSLWRWLDGRGIVQSANFQGVRGVCDRSHIQWPDNWSPSRRKPQHGDFELDSVVVNDALVTVKNPNFRPFSVSLFQCKLSTFRKQWMLYDILCADSIVGSIDDCLFSVHKPQIKDLNQQNELKQNWSKMV